MRVGDPLSPEADFALLRCGYCISRIEWNSKDYVFVGEDGDIYDQDGDCVDIYLDNLKHLWYLFTEEEEEENEKPKCTCECEDDCHHQGASSYCSHE